MIIIRSWRKGKQMADETCPHFAQAVPDDFDCSGCAIAKECYDEWHRQYDEIVEEELAGWITHERANERYTKLGCEVPDAV